MKKYIAFFLCLLFTQSLFAENLKLEVSCPKTYVSFSKRKRTDLCQEQKKCDWKVEVSGERSSSWRSSKGIFVRELSVDKKLRAEVGPGVFVFKLPWCFKSSIRLPNEKVLSLLRKEKETLYLYPEDDKSILPRLRSIKHPCRKLKSVESPVKGHLFYYLEPQNIKACS